MIKIKKIPTIIWANIIFFVYVILALIGGVISRNMSSEWENMKDVRLDYDMFYGLGFTSICILAIVGLLLRREWGRKFSIILCFILFFSNFVLRLGVYIYFKYSYNESIILLDPDAIAISILSFLFLVLLTRTKVREFYRHY